MMKAWSWFILTLKNTQDVALLMPYEWPEFKEGLPKMLAGRHFTTIQFIDKGESYSLAFGVLPYTMDGGETMIQSEMVVKVSQPDADLIEKLNLRHKKQSILSPTPGQTLAVGEGKKKFNLQKGGKS